MHTPSQLIQILNQIKNRADAATPGPWFIGNGVSYGNPNDPNESYSLLDNCTGETDEFVAHSRTDVPALIAALEKCIEQRDAVIHAMPLEKLPNGFIGTQVLFNAEIVAILQKGRTS